MKHPNPHPDDAVHVTVVEAPACHFCEEAHAALSEAATAYPIVVRTVDMRSAVGLNLVQRHRASMSPLVLLDDEFFSHGRLPRRKLAKHLERRFGKPAATRAV